MSELRYYRVKVCDRNLLFLHWISNEIIEIIAGMNAAVQLVKEMDVNVITGLLKLYFRELPEALFTDGLYSGFVKGMGKYY